MTPLFIISFLWQLPQNIIGALLLAALSLHRSPEDAHTFFEPENFFTIRYINSQSHYYGCSLGNFLFLFFPNTTGASPAYADYLYEIKVKAINHERAHARQSRRLGPLYLPLIALPSLLLTPILSPELMAKFYTERWFFPVEKKSHVS